MDRTRLKLKRGDLVAVLLVVCLAVGLGGWLWARLDPTEHPVAVVYQNGQVLRTIDLSTLEEPVVFTVEGDYLNEITAEPGRIRVSRSDCPGEDCVHSGWIGSAGRNVVCLPNRLELRIQGGASDVDAVAR